MDKEGIFHPEENLRYLGRYIWPASRKYRLKFDFSPIKPINIIQEIHRLGEGTVIYAERKYYILFEKFRKKHKKVAQEINVTEFNKLAES